MKRALQTALAAALLTAALSPVRAAGYLGVARGYPVLRDKDGKKLADGAFAQWLEGDELVAVIDYDFADGRHAEERARFGLRPDLAQRAWSWRETKAGVDLRRFDVDLVSGKATSAVREGREVRRWSKDLKLAPGRTFCGFGFTSALARLLPPGGAARSLSLTAVVFTPKPRAAPVTVTDEGQDTLSMAGRTVIARRYHLRAALPAPVRKLAGLHDYRIWLTEEPPPGFLRVEGPLAEPRDPVVRIDVSGP